MFRSYWNGYDVFNCNPDDISQHFNLKHIYNEYDIKLRLQI